MDLDIAQVKFGEKTGVSKVLERERMNKWKKKKGNLGKLQLSSFWKANSCLVR